MYLNKRLVFTICCNNYLAQALTLGDSIKIHNPNLEFIIGLVDDPITDGTQLKYKTIPANIVVESKTLAHMSKNYDITELCTAVKPHYFKYFFESRISEQVLYLDPDIVVFHSFEEVFILNETHSIVVTPHFCSPPTNSRFSGDSRVLSGGIYNLGFIIINNNPKASIFLNWWKLKSLNEFYVNIDYFTDQLWVNCVTCYCEDALVLRNLGYNMANWNLHERRLIVRDNKYYVNGEVPLIFFHFSHYSPVRPDQMTSLDRTILLSERPDVVPVFNYYLQQLKGNNYDYFKTIRPIYLRKRIKILPAFLKKMVIRVCVKALLLLKHG